MIGTVWYKKANPLNQSALFAIQGLFFCDLLDFFHQNLEPRELTPLFKLPG